MTDTGDAGPPKDADPLGDALCEALRDARPTHDGVSAALRWARIASRLFGAAAAVRVGRYELESKAGAGGGGDVFVARDPELSRRVAIKLIRAGGYRERMLAEGQALARLSHPNVVPVYDAGTLDDKVYLVMELVEGDTLRAYCESARRSVREIVRAYRQAGEGLAAAHRAGFIHRDFKPDNALIGRDGRVRVVDFGLARGGPGGPDEPAGEGSAMLVTQPGLGTPRYMAPEQAAGATLTAAVDQYAFCVSLREGLLAGGPAVPRWLDAIIRRGTTAAAADRYPSMAALNSALDRDPATRWRRRGLAAGVLGLATVAFVVGRSERAAAPACDGAAVELARAWSPVSSLQVATHLGALASPYARQAAPHALATLDGYATRWRAGYRDACLAYRDGTQSAALFDRRGACLSRARAALGTAAAVVGAASAEQLAAAVRAIGELPDIDRCADPSVLTTSVVPPPPASAAAVVALSDELVSLEVEVRAARPNVRPRIEAAVAKARTLGYVPVVARALRLSGFAALTVNARLEAVAPLAEATTLALTAGDHALAVEAFARRVFAAGTVHVATPPDHVLDGVEYLQAIADGLPPSDRAVRALLDNSLGNVALARGQRDRARAAFERALRTAREITGPARLEAASIWTNVGLVIDDPPRRAALANERIAIVEAGLDRGHPLVLAARITAAYFETDRQRAPEALQAPCNQLVELQPEQDFDIMQCQFQLGWLAVERGDRGAAATAFRHAVATHRRGGRPVLAKAYLDLLADRLPQALAQLDIALAEIGPLEHAQWFVLFDAADTMLACGLVQRQAGHEVEARAAFESARQALEKVVAVNSTPPYGHRLASAQASLVRTWTGALPPDARRHAEAALVWYRTAGGYADVVAELESALAR